MAEASTSSPGEYRVLARKYRPAAFAELIGQDAMVKTLANAIETGRLAHAFLLTGVRGVGKTTTARLIEKLGTKGAISFALKHHWASVLMEIERNRLS